ncbi:LuxR family transcriptional regulator [Eggerthellaceae bacterium zg-893]|nr:LuxR family transcriptional regulator [Eggerthellaceae bacterium zg-893]
MLRETAREAFRALSKRVPSYMLNFEVRPGIVFGFTCYWSWVWVVFWSSLFYAEAPPASLFGVEGLDSLGALWFFSLLFMSATLLVISCLGEKASTPAARTLFMALAASLTAVGTAMVAFPSQLFAPSVLPQAYAFGASLLGVGSAFEMTLWAELLACLGSRQSVVYFVGSTVASVVAFVLLVALGTGFSRFVTACLPVVGMVLFSRQRGLVEGVARASDRPADGDVENRSARAVLVDALALSLFFGVSYGVMKGLFVFEGGDVIAFRDQLNALSMVIASLAIFVTMGMFRMDFRRLTYQVALPLMASGFVLFPAFAPLNLVGFFLHQIGYQYFYTVIWALWPVMASRCRVSRMRLVSLGIFGVQFGQLAGSLAGAFIIGLGLDSQGLGLVSSVSVFVVLVVALFAFGNPVPSDGWITLRPFGQHEERRSKFRQSLESLSTVRGLSPRETEVFELLARGRNKQAIARQLCISENTAKTHIKNVYRKLGVHSQQAMMDMIELDAKGK